MWTYFSSAWCAVFSFLAGVLIDLDHLVDFYSSHSFTLKARTIYDACARIDLDRLYLPLHSYELLAIIWVTIYFFSLADIWKAIAIGLTQHLIFDQFTNPLKTLSYFLTYRAMKGFDKRLLLREARSG